MPAHTETGDSSSFAVIISAVLGIDIVDQLFAHISFIAVGRIDGAIPIPTVQAVGSYDDHIEIRSHLSQIGFCIGGPRIVTSSITVEQIGYRVFFLCILGIAGRQDNDIFNLFFHGRTVNRDRVYFLGLSWEVCPDQK